MTIGFIGCGNMATAIISGIIKNRAFKANEVCAYDVNSSATEKAQSSFGITPMESECDVVNNSDIVVLAVKPNVLADVLKTINKELTKKDTLLISIAAGKTTDFIYQQISTENRIIRVMPNINATVGEAICGYTANKFATNEDKQEAERIFSSVGKVIYLEENHFPLFGVLGGCAPAYAYMFIDALARAGVENGMKKDVALEIAAQTVLGSAKMILESKEHPWELIDKVCSPGGTTIEGVLSLQADGFEAAVHNAVNKAVEKDSKL